MGLRIGNVAGLNLGPDTGCTNRPFEWGFPQSIQVLAVSILTRQRVDDCGIWVQFTAGADIFPCLASGEIGYGIHPACPVGTTRGPADACYVA